MWWCTYVKPYANAMSHGCHVLSPHSMTEILEPSARPSKVSNTALVYFYKACAGVQLTVKNDGNQQDDEVVPDTDTQSHANKNTVE